LRDAIELYGGFVGNESQLSARNSSINQTIIDASEANGGSPANHAVLMDSLTHSRIDGFRITGGEATDFGGGILCLNLNPTNTIAHCVIQGNRVLLAGVGAGISCIDSSPFISDCIISGNDASVHDLAPGGRGGGLYCSNASPTLTQTTILGNTANDGGGIYCVNGSSPIFSNCSILNNQAILFIPPPPAIVDGGRGGALWCDASSPILTDSTIGGNQAASSGGGFHVTQNSVLTISRSSIVANIAFLGGGMFVVSATASLSQCLISANQATSNGGGIYGFNATSLEIVSCVLSGNASYLGAAVACENSPLISLINCTISDNKAHLGGGIHLIASGPNILNTIFSNNSAHAVYESDTGSDPTLSHCLFHRNPNGDYLDEGALTHNGAEAIDSQIAEASDTIDGDPMFKMGAFGVWSESPSYANSTGRTRLVDSAAAFTPGTLVGGLINPNTTQTHQAYIVSHTETTFEVLAEGVVTQGDAYQIVDYHLGFLSAAIDRGFSAGAPTADIEGQPHGVDIGGHGSGGTDSVFDIGAYEVQLPQNQVHGQWWFYQ
jgi:hypothetical protein